MSPDAQAIVQVLHSLVFVHCIGIVAIVLAVLVAGAMAGGDNKR